MFCLVRLQSAWARLDTGGQVSGGQRTPSIADSDPRLQPLLLEQQGVTTGGMATVSESVSELGGAKKQLAHNSPKLR